VTALVLLHHDERYKCMGGLQDTFTPQAVTVRVPHATSGRLLIVLAAADDLELHTRDSDMAQVLIITMIQSDMAQVIMMQSDKLPEGVKASRSPRRC
jgi:hypothetical protein